MKRKKILEVPVKKPKEKAGKQVTAQILELTSKKYLILDIWKDGKLYARHAMDTDTGEYGTYHAADKTWHGDNLANATGHGGYWSTGASEKEYPLSKKDKETILSATKEGWVTGAYRRIENKEAEYARMRYEKKAESKARRIRDLMALCPEPGKAVEDWIADMAFGGLHYAFWEKGNNVYHCTACGGSFPAAGVKRKHRERMDCPLCGHPVTIIKRGDQISAKTALTMIHDLDEKRGVERHFLVEIVWTQDGRKIYLDETIRLMLLREGKYCWKAYYAAGWDGWSEGNGTNRRWYTGYLYPDKDGIREGLKGTAYEPWMDVLPQLAQAGIKADYNRLLTETRSHFIQITEYLFKGRFYRLLKEISEEISYYHGYAGSLRTGAETIEGVMQLKDRQKINRLRQEDGGKIMLQWLQWSDAGGGKLSDETLKWFEKEAIGCGTYYQKSRAAKYLTPEQLMHYIDRQQKESYPKKKKKAVLEQYEDYLDMAEQLGRHMDDAMIYRPRELKRRHDEAVKECNRRQEELRRKKDKEAAERQAEAMRQKYPGYEEILQEVRQKYEYADDAYLIRVPESFMEITAEGMALHHCVGSTERYFDRIVSRETYICFLRQQSSPETPFYTIEVEPGGTIRQHRGAYDEEPGIEEIKPFLRKWQAVIRKRMSKEDHVYAEKSAELRRKNIEELQEKNNTRVLNGLMEDLMEAI